MIVTFYSCNKDDSNPIIPAVDSNANLIFHKVLNDTARWDLYSFQIGRIDFTKCDSFILMLSYHTNIKYDSTKYFIDFCYLEDTLHVGCVHSFRGNAFGRIKDSSIHIMAIPLKSFKYYTFSVMTVYFLQYTFYPPWVYYFIFDEIWIYKKS
jgi:hypothetical protein